MPPGATEVAAEPSGGTRSDASGGVDREVPTLARAGTVGRPEPVEDARAGNSKPVSRIPATDDEVIAAARDAADRLTEGLPDFIVQQNTTRYFSRALPPQWQVLDVVTAEVTSVGGKEDYRNIMVNGKPSNRPIEKTGAWSTGEFQTTLESLLNPYTAGEVPQGQR